MVVWSIRLCISIICLVHDMTQKIIISDSDGGVEYSFMYINQYHGLCLVHDPEDKNIMRDAHRDQTGPDCSVMAELKQDSNLTREKRRLELPLSSRLEVTRLEQVNLSAGVQGGGRATTWTEPMEVRDCGSTFNPLFICFFF